ncbi:MAG: hypothetical protein JXQ69_08385 [Paludibacteraceae bacterium]|nr:hypothetical protein [Paludibacteraceae bacterium]
MKKKIFVLSTILTVGLHATSINSSDVTMIFGEHGQNTLTIKNLNTLEMKNTYGEGWSKWSKKLRKSLKKIGAVAIFPAIIPTGFAALRPVETTKILAATASGQFIKAGVLTITTADSIAKNPSIKLP